MRAKVKTLINETLKIILPT